MQSWHSNLDSMASDHTLKALWFLPCSLCSVSKMENAEQRAQSGLGVYRMLPYIFPQNPGFQLAPWNHASEEWTDGGWGPNICIQESPPRFWCGHYKDRQGPVSTICLTLPPPSPQPIKHWAGTRHAPGHNSPWIGLLKSRRRWKRGWSDMTLSWGPHASLSDPCFLSHLLPNHWSNSPLDHSRIYPGVDSMLVYA